MRFFQRLFSTLLVLFVSSCFLNEAQGQVEHLLLPEFSDNNELFGYDVSIDGQYMAVSAPDNDIVETLSGAVYIFSRGEETWEQEERILVREGNTIKRFGTSVSLEGERLLVGASWDNFRAGSAFYLERDASGEWIVIQKLEPPVDAYRFFGESVLLRGSYAFIGALFGGPNERGAVYVYKQTRGGWQLEDVLVPQNDFVSDEFGTSLAFDGVHLVVGAPGSFHADQESPGGAIHVFQKEENQWVETQTLIAPDLTNSSEFGTSVNIAGPFIVAGSPFDNGVAHKAAGSAFVFQYTGNDWVFDSKLEASDGFTGERFGAAVAIEENRILVGAPGEFDETLPVQFDKGAVYEYQQVGGQWVEQRKMQAEQPAYDSDFGYALDLDGEQAAIGAYRYLDNDGGAYVIELGPYVPPPDIDRADLPYAKIEGCDLQEWNDKFGIFTNQYLTLLNLDYARLKGQLEKTESFIETKRNLEIAISAYEIFDGFLANDDATEALVVAALESAGLTLNILSDNFTSAVVQEMLALAAAGVTGNASGYIFDRTVGIILNSYFILSNKELKNSIALNQISGQVMFSYYSSCNDVDAVFEQLGVTKPPGVQGDFLLIAAEAYAERLGLYFDEEKIDAFIKATISSVNRTYIDLNDVFGNDGSPMLWSINPPRINTGFSAPVELYGAGFDIHTEVEYNNGSGGCPCRFKPSLEEIPNSSTILFPANLIPEEGQWAFNIVKRSEYSEERQLEVLNFSDAEPPPKPTGLRYTFIPYTLNDQYIISWDEVEDQSGLAAIWWKADTLPQSCTDGTRSALPRHDPLALLLPGEGMQPMNFWFEDGAGNCSSSSQITLQRDTSPPQLEILEPVSTGTYFANELFVQLAGSYEDAISGVASMRWQNELGEGGVIEFEAGRWESPGIALQPGENRITVIAEDRVGLIELKSIEIIFEQPEEAIAMPIMDSFESNSLDPLVWDQVGSNADIVNNVLAIESSANPDEDMLLTKSVSFETGEFLTASREFYFQPQSEAYDVRLSVEIEGQPEATFGVAYINHSTSEGGMQGVDGVYLFKNNADPRNVADSNVVAVVDSVHNLTGTWFEEEFRLNGIGKLAYYLDGKELMSMSVDAFLHGASQELRFRFYHAGDGTGDVLYVDNFAVSTYDASVVTSVEEFIVEEPSSHRVEVYPNPFSHEITVVASSPQPERLKVSLFDMLGREVQVLYEGRGGEMSSPESFDLSFLPTGVYVLQMEGESWRQTQLISKIK